LLPLKTLAYGVPHTHSLITSRCPDSMPGSVARNLTRQ
jgi:hypothetical protein